MRWGPPFTCLYRASRSPATTLGVVSVACVGRRKWEGEQKDNSMPFAPLDKALVEYQDPKKVDKIVKIQADLEETKEVLVRRKWSGGLASQSLPNSGAPSPLVIVRLPHDVCWPVCVVVGRWTPLIRCWPEERSWT